MSKEYSYTNSNDETIVVSQEHIDTAIEIYQELSKSSRSKKVSWKKHKKMMETEGYYDSDTNENYRQLIKRMRKEIGVLPSVEKHADMLASSKLQSIREEMGNIQASKLEANDEYTRLAKLKREWNRELLIVETIKESMDKIDWDSLLEDNVDIMYDPDELTDNVVSITNLTDIHHSYLRDGENFALEPTQNILNAYLEKLIAFGKKEKVSKFIITNLGDSIEGYLRAESLLHTRQLAVEQMIEVTQLIIEFLSKLSKHFPVKYLTIVGNHDRVNKNKHDAMDKEDYNIVHEALMKRACKELDIDYIEKVDHYYHILKVNGRNFYLAHGDRDNIRSPKLLAELSILHNTPIDVVMVGHFHSHSVVEVSDDKYQIVTGSLKGSDSFSAKINKSSSRSQVSVLVNDNGDIDIRQIKL